MSEIDLDIQFGAAITPPYITEGEKLFNPTTLHRLDDSTAKLVQSYFWTAVSGFKIPQLTHQCGIILWLLDEECEMWFSFEEVTYIDELQTRRYHPLSRTLDFAKEKVLQKLGHPALLKNDRKARIGGEILYDEDFGPNGWIISNKSGRYGAKSKPQSKNQLFAAASVWAKFGIQLDVHYLGTD